MARLVTREATEQDTIPLLAVVATLLKGNFDDQVVAIVAWSPRVVRDDNVHLVLGHSSERVHTPAHRRSKMHNSFRAL